MRYLLLGILLFCIDWFAFQAVKLSAGTLSPSVDMFLGLMYWAVPVFTIFYAIGIGGRLRQFMSRKSRTIITALIFILYFSKLLTGVVVLLDDVRRIGAWLLTSISGVEFITSRLPVMAQIGLAVGVIPAVLLIYGLLRNPYRYKVHKVQIGKPGLPETLEGLRIVQISDIHTGSLMDRDRVSRSVELINALEPDIVCFTGDLVNSSADEADPFIDIFSRINARYGTFSIVGNHDYGDYVQWPDADSKRANFEKLKHQHSRLGWKLLLNDHRVVDIGGAKISIIGVENYSAHPRFQKYGNMQMASAGMPDSDFTLLLSHDPSHWDDEITTRYNNVDLTLSGHTHGFQFGIEIGSKFRWSPVQYVYRRWAGHYRQGSQHLYINRGLGFLGYPGRVGILPEITQITLTSKVA